MNTEALLDPQAECAVLATTMLGDGESMYETSELTAMDFGSVAHQKIFAAIEGIVARGEAPDLVSVASQLRDMGHLDSVGGPEYLSRIADYAPFAMNISSYLKTIRHKSILRRLIAATEKIRNGCLDVGCDADSALDIAEREIFSISAERESTDFEHIASVADRVISDVQEQAAHPGRLSGIPTGYADLDKKTGGLHRGDLTIIAARPSMGKTALATGIMLNAAQSGYSVGMLSLEMGREQLLHRMICSMSGVDTHAARMGFVTQSQIHRMSDARAGISNLQIYIDDGTGVSVSGVQSRVRRLKARHGLDLIVIDYLGLMKTGRAENRNLAIGEISRACKCLAKELDIAVVLLSQLNRSIETRQNKRPELSDLRDSGEIEQDADIVAFIYRDEVYNPESEDAGIAEIIIRKQRNGPIGTVRLAWVPDHASFRNLSDTF